MTREMLVRRVVSSLILLAIVAVVVLAVVKGIGLIAGESSQSGAQSSAKAASPTQSGEVAKMDGVPVCAARDLQVTATADPVSPLVGEGLSLGISVQNRSDKACALNTADLHASLRSGDYTMWTPTECSSAWQKKLLLAPGVPWQGGFTWDGRMYESCKLQTNSGGVGLVADAGTYRLQVAVGEEWLESPLSFEIR